MNQLFLFFQKAIWSPPILLFLGGIGVFLGILLLSHLRIPEKNQAEKYKEKGDIPPFTAIMTSLAGAIGTGSIVGVATAITMGGIGSLVWMWIAALFLLPIKFSESLLSLHYRKTDRRGEIISGPMLYMVKGLGWHRMAWLFALLGVAGSLFGTGNWIQIHSIADVTHHIWNVPPFWVGATLSVLTLWIILGGIHSIGRVAAILVPSMSLLYLLGACFVLIICRKHLPDVFHTLLTSAWHPKAIWGGVAGATLFEVIQLGTSRSILCTEAGLGISSISAAAAKTATPIRQAGWLTLGSVFFPLVICTMTGLAIAAAVQSNPDFPLYDGAALVTEAFCQAFTGGEYIVSLGLILFAYSTILAWAYAGEKCIAFLWGERAILPYRFFFAFWLIPGSLLSIDAVWPLADITNGLMMLPNLLALLFLGKKLKDILLTHPSFTQVSQ